MKKYDFNKTINRKNTNCFKWDDLKSKFGRNDLIPMWVADMDFRAAKPLLDEFKKRCRHGVFGYSFHPESYYQSIINWMQHRHNWQIERNWIVNTPGIVPALNFAIQSYTDPGDRILIQTPVYDPFFQGIISNGRKVVTSPLKIVLNHYEMDFVDLETKLKQDIKIMILCSPHNPVGRVWTRQELINLSELCIKNNVILIADEIHSDLIFSKYEHIPVASISEDIGLRTIVLNAPSKTFNIAGLITAYAIIPKAELRDKFNEFLTRNHLLMGNIFGNIALQTVYERGESWLEQLLIYLEENYEYLCDFFANQTPKIKPLRMEGTYLAWLDFRDFELSNFELEKLVIHKAKVGLNPGVQYGKNGSGFMRMNFGCPRSILKKALARLKKTFIVY